VRFVTWAIKNKPEDEEQTVRLKYINAGPMGTAELALGEAKNEIVHFAQICRNGLGYIRSAVNAAKEDEFEVYRKKLVKYEEIADRIEREIAAYLKQLQISDISEVTSDRIRAIYKVISELESLGDSGESVSRVLSRKNIHSKTFSEQDLKNIASLAHEVERAYDVMISNLTLSSEDKDVDLEAALNAENRINAVRNNLREEEMIKIENKGDYLTSVYYLDTLSELEKMGDYLVNITQALAGLKA
jgi:phosphate:Na+ symporter